jgi:hemolysin-activating ACP:hemolysin acyltransferase
MNEPSKTADAAGAPPADSAQKPEMTPEIQRRIARLRSALRENFGMAVLALMNLPRYNSQSVADLQHLVLDPMMNDRIAFAYPGRAAGEAEASTPTEEDRDTAGFAIWASVSEEVDARIRQQIAQGVFPIRLKPAEWNSGSIHWLFDVVTPNPKTAAAVIANFKQVVKEGDLRLHPLITRLVDPALLEKMGARPASGAAATAATAEASGPGASQPGADPAKANGKSAS